MNINKTVQYHEYKAWYEKKYGIPVIAEPIVDTHWEVWQAASNISVRYEGDPDQLSPITGQLKIINESVVQPALRPAVMGLFPTMHDLQSVVDLAHSQLPLTNSNSIVGLLMTYHNTLLSVMEQETNFVQRK